MGQTEFPLETLLGHRRRQEEARRLDLAAVERQLVVESATLFSLREQHRLSLESIRGAQTSARLDVDRITRALAYVASLDKAIGAQERVVRDLEIRLDEARARLLAANREAKVVEKLKDVWLDEQQLVSLRHEEKIAAELAINQFNRRIGAS